MSAAANDHGSAHTGPKVRRLRNFPLVSFVRYPQNHYSQLKLGISQLLIGYIYISWDISTIISVWLEINSESKTFETTRQWQWSCWKWGHLGMVRTILPDSSSTNCCLVVWTYLSEKYDFVTWDYYSQYMENKKCSKPPTSRFFIHQLEFLCFREPISSGFQPCSEIPP